MTAVAWDSNRRYALVGLDSGKVFAFFASKDCRQFTHAHDFQFHTKRVGAMVYHPGKDILITVGRDSLLVVFSMARMEVISQATIGSAWLANVVYDAANDHVFIGTFDNQLFVYDIGTPVRTYAYYLYFITHLFIITHLFYYSFIDYCYSFIDFISVSMRSIQSIPFITIFLLLFIFYFLFSNPSLTNLNILFPTLIMPHYSSL